MGGRHRGGMIERAGGAFLSVELSCQYHSGSFTYIITTRRITSGELSKYRNGFVDRAMRRDYAGLVSGANVWADRAFGSNDHPHISVPSAGHRSQFFQHVLMQRGDLDGSGPLFGNLVQDSRALFEI